MSQVKEHWTSAKVKALLQSYYGGGEKHAVLFEVRNATGFDASRSIDAVTMSLWPSLGLATWNPTDDHPTSEAGRPSEVDCCVYRCVSLR